MPIPIYPSAFIIATILSTHGYHKGSLSLSGAIAAFVIGYGHLANPLKVFGVGLIGFYLLGSRATKVKVEVKARLEDGVDVHKAGGNRNWVQVFSNTLPSLMAALYYRFGCFSPQTHLTDQSVLSTRIPKQLIYLAVAQLSTNFADTLSSEIGILSPSPPRYILSGKTVPPGTNGGISPLGLAASLTGGGIMGTIVVVDLYIEDPGCRGSSGWTGQVFGWAGEMFRFGIVSGLLGSLLDSLLGAICQRTLYSIKDNRILTDHSTRPRSGPDIKQIGIGRDILSNSGVNFLSGLIMAGIGWWWAS